LKEEPLYVVTLPHGHWPLVILGMPGPKVFIAEFVAHFVTHNPKIYFIYSLLIVMSAWL